MSDTLREQLQLALGRQYALERELAGGGMSRVFVAREVRLDRDVVVKVLSPHIAGELSAERFEREIRVVAALQEPHVVPVLAAGATGEGLPYYTMPFVAGESLRERLRRGPMATTEAVRVLRDVATALEHAHAHGVVHRDIKPENVLLSGRTAVVTDFGIAKAIGVARTATSPDALANADGATALTVAGASIGTPAYMAPEQALGAEVDARADVYAWGVLAYELLAGTHPFAGRTAPQLLAAHVAETPPALATGTPGVSSALAALVAGCLAKDAAKRPQGAGEILRVLDGLDDASMRNRPMASAVFIVALVAILSLVVVSAIWWSSRARVAPAAVNAGSARVVAVLPFENLGAPSDAYFADGVSDAVRGKLASIPALTVIARTSSVQYRGTRKSPSDIARELGARYLLTGTVRWSNSPDGTSRVQVSPELVETNADTPPAVRWQEPFDAAFTDVFQVQGDIATQVAERLDVALGAGERGRIAEPPTRNLDAYDAYLRAEEMIQGWAVANIVTMRRVIPLYERAIALDSNFTGAWVRLARANVFLYSNGGPDPATAAAARRAQARAEALAPDDPRVLVDRAQYDQFVAHDAGRALEALKRAERVAPHDVEVLNALAEAEHELGEQPAALEHALRAVMLDPRSARALRIAGDRLAEARRLSEADAYYRRAQLIAPRSEALLNRRVSVFLMKGDLAGARAVVREFASVHSPTDLVATLAKYSDLFWVLDEEQQRLLLRLRPDAFNADTGAWALALAETHALRGDSVHMRVYADSARDAYERILRVSPNDAELNALHGIALSYLGRHAAARSAAERSVSLAPMSRDLATGPYTQHQFVRILTRGGDRDAAVARLAPLLGAPYVLTPAWLRVDPGFAPLRGHPGFERLIAGTH